MRSLLCGCVSGWMRVSPSGGAAASASVRCDTDDVEARFGEPERRSAFLFPRVATLRWGRCCQVGSPVRERNERLRRARDITAAFAFGREQLWRFETMTAGGH
jgi:hypothetical protein